MKKYALIILMFACVYAAAGQEKTLVNDRNAASRLLGRHMLSLQWISWDRFGAATVTNKVGVYNIKGEQKGRGNSDILKIDGRITRIDAKEFEFDGTIVTKVSHINNGDECKREGVMTFRITGARKYWRLVEMNNPCEQVTDYVDIYFRR